MSTQNNGYLSIKANIATLLFVLCLISYPAHAQLYKAIDDCKQGRNRECLNASEFVVLKDWCGPSQLLLVPKRASSGINDPNVSQRDAFNYFNAAWEAAQQFLEKLAILKVDPKIHLERDQIGLAINSTVSITDPQFHIHIDRVRPEVTKQLRDNGRRVAFRMRLSDGAPEYTVVHVKDLDENPLFELRKKVGQHSMQFQTLVVIGAADGGFFILNNQAPKLKAHRADSNNAHGEDLEIDHDPRNGVECHKDLNGWKVETVFRPSK